jgi:tRNA(Ile2) C34 agmatinyltransferase TiaS
MGYRMIYVGVDDTDTLESRGTGRLARSIAAELSIHYKIFGVTRHQLFVHKDIPFTSHNSCAVIHADAPNQDTQAIFALTKKLMLADFVEGSDPGLAIATSKQVTPAIAAFGQDAKTMIVTQQRAVCLANNCNILLEGLGGTNGGIIGALAGIGLAALGNDGRFLLKGKNRELGGERTATEIINAGIDQILTLQGENVTKGKVLIPKNATPSFIHGKAVLFVEQNGDGMVALKRA